MPDTQTLVAGFQNLKNHGAKVLAPKQKDLVAGYKKVKRSFALEDRVKSIMAGDTPRLDTQNKKLAILESLRNKIYNSELRLLDLNRNSIM